MYTGQEYSSISKGTTTNNYPEEPLPQANQVPASQANPYSVYSPAPSGTPAAYSVGYSGPPGNSLAAYSVGQPAGGVAPAGRGPPGFEQCTVGAWKDDVFNCFTQCVPSFCMASCCPCVIGGQIAEKVQFASCCTVVTVYTTLCIVLFIIVAATRSALFWLICWLFCFLMAWKLRSIVRNILAIPGSWFMDMLLSLLCTSCTIAQLARQLFNYRDSCEPILWDSDGTPYYNRRQVQGIQYQQPGQHTVTATYPQAYNQGGQHAMTQPYTSSYPQMYATVGSPQVNANYVGTVQPVGNAAPAMAPAYYAGTPTNGNV